MTRIHRVIENDEIALGMINTQFGVIVKRKMRDEKVY